MAPCRPWKCRLCCVATGMLQLWLGLASTTAAQLPKAPDPTDLSYLHAVGHILIGLQHLDKLPCVAAIDAHAAVIAATGHQLVPLANEGGLLNVCLHIAVPCRMPTDKCPAWGDCLQYLAYAWPVFTAVLGISLAR